MAGSEIKGFNECYERLYMPNYFTEEQLQQINSKYLEMSSDEIYVYVRGAEALGRMKTSSFEEELELQTYLSSMNFEQSVRASKLVYYPFMEIYINNGCFDYLLIDDYWAVTNNKGLDWQAGCFDLEGNPIEQQIPYIRDAFKHNELKEKVRNLLLSNGITEVVDIKVFATYGLVGTTFMYIKCPDNEYLIRLYIQGSVDVEEFELHQCSDFLELVNETEKSSYEKNMMNKEFYEAEALSLQQEGLLKGNEKGLDLMKPLTRIEAATMILRAIGEDAATGGVQTFSDVPSYHWGFSAASKAQKLGIIKGIGNNMFAPDRIVSVTEFSTMVLRAAKYGNFDWQKATDILVEKGILTEEQTATMDWFTRGDMAKIIYVVRAKGLLN